MMSLRQKIGQLLVVGFRGTTVDTQHPIYNAITQDAIGSVILFDKDLPRDLPIKNLVNRPQITALTAQLQNFAKAAGLPPMWIGVDYEGGAVDRLKNVSDCPSTYSPADQAALPKAERLHVFKTMAQTLESLGFNLNFYPLLDLNLAPQAGIIGARGRSFSADPAVVTQVAKEVVDTFQDAGIQCCYKHFPGHGSAIGDSHEGFVDVTDTFQDVELLPYASLASKDASMMIMTAHVINRTLDPSGLPATLSYPILTGLLREKLGFEGIIISDDIQMRALSDHFSLPDILMMTLNAGADMIIVGNQLGELSPKTVIDEVVRLVETDKISQDRIQSAFNRVMHAKSTAVVLG